MISSALRVSMSGNAANRFAASSIPSIRLVAAARRSRSRFRRSVTAMRTAPTTSSPVNAAKSPPIVSVSSASSVSGISIPQRHPVLARLGPGDQRALLPIDPDRLPAAMRALDVVDAVAHRLELARRVPRHAALHFALALIRQDPRQIERLLDVEA